MMIVVMMLAINVMHSSVQAFDEWLIPMEGLCYVDKLVDHSLIRFVNWPNRMAKMDFCTTILDGQKDGMVMEGM